MSKAILSAIDWIGRYQVFKDIWDNVCNGIGKLSKAQQERWTNTVNEYKGKGFNQKDAEIEALRDLGIISNDEYNSLKRHQ